MPIWLIEFFGASDLNSAFVLIALMTAPVWIAMLVFPNQKVVRMIGQPLVVAPLYSIVLIVLLWQSYKASLVPGTIADVSYDAARKFTRHPIAFLALFCNLQILNLALGTMIYQKARRYGMRVAVELVLCWLVGALAVVPFAVRLLIIRRKLPV